MFVTLTIVNSASKKHYKYNTIVGIVLDNTNIFFIFASN